MTTKEIQKSVVGCDESIDLNKENIGVQDSNKNDLALAMQCALRLFDVRLSLTEIMSDMPPCPESKADQNQWAMLALQKRGMIAVWQPLLLKDVKLFLLPAVMRMADSFVVLTHFDEKICRIIVPDLSDRPIEMSTAEVISEYGGELLLIRPKSHMDHRANDLMPGDNKHWFWNTLWGFKRYMLEAVALSIIINILVLAMSIFIMTVYNRVLPNQTYVTLWTMAIGVTIALVFELCARIARAWLTDRAGKKIDLILGARIFRHVLQGKMENRAQSNGAFGNVMQSFETVRELSTSAALTTVADLPFVFLFLIVIHLVAGPLVWCVIMILLVIISMILLMQIPLKRHAEESIKIGSNRYGLVIESLDNLETIKALRAENLVSGKHDIASVKLSAVSMKSRFLTTIGASAIQSIQQFGTVVLLLWGVYLVGDGSISMGGIIATMTLMGRAVTPIATLAALGLRIQQARTSLDILNKVMQTPTERENEKVYVQLPQGSKSEIVCRNLTFTYKKDFPAVVEHLDLHLKHGERVAILGKMGSGKSSLLRLLIGLYQPTEGEISVGGVDIRQIAPAELRSRIALVNQEPRLMFGTMRDNLLMGAPHASDAEMMRVAALTGVSDIVARHPMGYGMPIGEKGETLSGGQKQAIALARAILTQPDVLLLDEPTSGMDMNSERMVLQALEPVMAGRTIIIVTHRPAILKYIDRIVMMDDGLKVADGPKDEIVHLLNEGKIPAASVLREALKPKISTIAHQQEKKKG